LPVNVCLLRSSIIIRAAPWEVLGTSAAAGRSARRSGLNVVFERFLWSGCNGFADRADAARSLRAALRETHWMGGSFWLATGLGWSFFMLRATYGHLYRTLREGNYAPYNFLTIFSDGFIAVWLLVLLYLYWRWVGFQQQDQVSRQQLTRKEPG
jgi:hypothetical protein